MASTAVWTDECAVMTMTGIVSPRSRRVSISSMPDMSGIIRSVRTRSGVVPSSMAWSSGSAEVKPWVA